MITRRLILFLVAGLALFSGQLGMSQEAPQGDTWVGQFVFFKSDAKAKIGDNAVDLETLDFPAEVKEIKGEWLWLGKAWVQKSECMLGDQALEYYSELVSKNPTSSNAWRRRAACWLEKGDDEKAVKDYDEAIRLDPKNARAYNERGLVRFELAIAELTLRAMKPAFEAVTGAIVGALGGAGANSKPDEADLDLADLTDAEKKLVALAIRDFDSAIAIDAKLASAYSNRGIARAQMEDLSGAMKDLNEAIRLGLKDDFVYALRAEVKSELKDYEGAVADFDIALKLNPNDEYNYRDRAYAKTALKDFTGAIRDFDEFIRRKPDDSRILADRAEAKVGAKDFEGAIRDYDDAIRMSGGRGLPIVSKALFLATTREEKFQQPDEALKLVEEVLTTMPTNSDALSVKACALAAKGKFEEAIEVERSAGQDKNWLKDKSSHGGSNSEARMAAWKEGKQWSPWSP